MIKSLPTPIFLFAGRLCRDYSITAKKKAILDVPGGNTLYASVGMKLWEPETPLGLLARIGEDYPQEWLEDFSQRGFDIRGIKIIPEAVDVRSFYIYTEKATRITDDPVPHFARLGIQFPKSLLGYHANTHPLNSRTKLSPISIRQRDIPPVYLEAHTIHLCPLDYLTHNLLPAIFRQIGFSTITLDPSMGYMNATYWDDIPALITGLTAFMCSEEKVRSLFRGRSDDLWEMAEAIAAYGCEIIIIKRGQQGQLLYDAASHSRWEIPSYPGRLENPTGAGDAFCGGFLVGYRRTYDPLQGVLYGNISASVVIEGIGAFFALDVLPGLPEARLEALQQSFRKV